MAKIWQQTHSASNATARVKIRQTMRSTRALSSEYIRSSKQRRRQRKRRRRRIQWTMSISDGRTWVLLIEGRCSTHIGLKELDAYDSIRWCIVRARLGSTHSSLHQTALECEGPGGKP